MAGLNWVLVNGNLQWGGTLAVGDGSATAPSLTFASEPTNGLYRAGAQSLGFVSANVSTPYAFVGGLRGFFVGQALNIGFSATNDASGAGDVFLGRDAANTLALKNADKSQTVRIYGSTATVDRYLAASCSTGGIASLRPVNITLSTAAAGNKVNIGSSDLTGYLMCGTSTGAPGLIAILGALSTTAEINDPKTSYSVVGGTTNMINVYWDSTAAQYAIENQTGANAVVSAIFLGR